MNRNPLVVARDFNTSPAMGDNRRLLKFTKDAAHLSRDVYPTTWFVGPQLPRVWRNDWFLLRNDVKVTQFVSIDPAGNSDHTAQSVYLTFGDRYDE